MADHRGHPLSETLLADLSKTEEACIETLPEEAVGPEQVSALVERKIEALTNFVARHVPYYTARLPARPTFADIPVVTKADLMLGLPGTTAEPHLSLEELRSWVPTDERDSSFWLFRDRYYVRRTSGTTGFVGFFLWDEGGAAAARASQSRFMPYLNDLPRPLVAVSPVVVLAPHSDVLLDMHAVPLTADLDGAVEMLQRLRPRTVIGSPAFTAAVAEEQLAGRLDIAPEAVMVWTERCLAHQRRTIADAWGVDPAEPYGTSETAGIAVRCDVGNFHVLADHVYLELLDSAGRPVGVGHATDRVIVTRLGGPMQPVLRYELGDVVVRGPDSCPCGKPFPTLAEIRGRARSRLWLEARGGGVTSLSAFLLIPALEDTAGLVRYQLRHDVPGLLEVSVLTSGPLDEARLVERLGKVITDAGAVTPEIRIVAGELPTAWAAPPGTKDHHTHLAVDEEMVTDWLVQRDRA